MRIDIKIQNLDKLTRGLSKFPNNLRGEFRSAMEKSIFLIEAKTKPITPVAQPWKWKSPRKGYTGGTLRQSIRKDYLEPFKAAISPHVNYAIYVHEGTRYWPLSKPPYMSGTVRQFMKEGAERAQPTIEAVFNSAVEKALMKSIY